MKIKLDENMPYHLAGLLRGLGHDADTVYEENICGANDSLIWDIAQQEGRFLITQDQDFSDMARFLSKPHHGVMFLRLSEPNRRILEEHIISVFRQENVKTWQGCVVVVSDTKIRVRKV